MRVSVSVSVSVSVRDSVRVRVRVAHFKTRAPGCAYIFFDISSMYRH